jgi:hypothetical protein
VTLWGLGFYAASLLAASLLQDHWPPMSYTALADKWRQFQEYLALAPGRPLLVMLGSSHVDEGFQAGRLEGLPGPGGKPLAAYNFGIPAAGPAHELLVLRDMLAAGLRPRLLLIEFLPLMLNEPRRGLISEEQWTSASWRSLSQMLALCPYFVHPVAKCQDWLQARLAPWYVLRYHLQGQLGQALFAAPPGDKEYIYDSWGHRIPEGPDITEIVHRGVRACYYNRPSLQQLHLGKRSVRALRDLLDLCRREHIAVQLVIMPESSAFRSWYDPGALTPMCQLLRQLQDTYGFGVIDARQWVADRDFLDGHHVSAAGGHVFTTRLLHEIGPWLRGHDGEYRVAAFADPRGR